LTGTRLGGKLKNTANTVRECGGLVVLRDEEGVNLALLLDPLFDAWIAGDVERIKDFLAEDVECRSPWAARPVHRGRDSVAMEMMARRQTFANLSTQEVLLGVRCATYMMSADGMRIAVTYTLRDDHKVQSVMVCAEADIPYQREIVCRT
jgi:hypothetical protein